MYYIVVQRALDWVATNFVVVLLHFNILYKCNIGQSHGNVVSRTLASVFT